MSFSTIFWMECIRIMNDSHILYFSDELLPTLGTINTVLLHLCFAHQVPPHSPSLASQTLTLPPLQIGHPLSLYAHYASLFTLPEIEHALYW
ncbi:hypothetical protein PISMIDRAFT_686292 [Pisolithus microcarpus 441]|uniref:Uncharacterized protein n=1 Tax=Pisolithus microcarpus 441 TaxID=765257 RepID=A0A0C9YIL4_9AGAM|nr:hypothetical protein PISMIDRAFT_686292 [Pisolithus microcarpus 441]